MKKERLAIVSSYDELCGNASYTKVLEQELSKFYDVTVLSLDVELLRQGRNKQALHHIKTLSEQLKEYDCVNFQLEAGLYGASPQEIHKNFFALVKSSKRVVITMHRYQSYARYPRWPSVAKCIFSFKWNKILAQYKDVVSNNRFVPFYHAVITFCQKHAIPIVVHTKREKKNIQLEFDHKLIYDHPLCFYDQQTMRELKKKADRDSFIKDFQLKKENVYIGLFGFINHYKGHETAIRALLHLPHNYELLICGAQHPHTILVNETINPYIESLLKLVEELKLEQRVKFIRLAKDEDFVNALINCDYNILPYLEVTQSGSAIASLTLESCSSAIFSQNRAFFELDKYATGAFSMFSIGNYLELANAILNYNPSKYSANINKYHETYNIHTSTTLYRSLLNRAFLETKVEKSSPATTTKELSTQEAENGY